MSFHCRYCAGVSFFLERFWGLVICYLLVLVLCSLIAVMFVSARVIIGACWAQITSLRWCWCSGRAMLRIVRSISRLGVFQCLDSTEGVNTLDR